MNWYIDRLSIALLNRYFAFAKFEDLEIDHWKFHIFVLVPIKIFIDLKAIHTDKYIIQTVGFNTIAALNTITHANLPSCIKGVCSLGLGLLKLTSFTFWDISALQVYISHPWSHIHIWERIYQHGLILIPALIHKYMHLKSLIHSQTSTVAPLKFENE